MQVKELTLTLHILLWGQPEAGNLKGPAGLFALSTALNEVLTIDLIFGQKKGGLVAHHCVT
jgi:hypothetical protein